MIKWILTLIASLFKPKPPVIPPVIPLKLTHPEEPMNPAQTAANTNPDSIILKWFQQWNVPPDSWDFFKNSVVLFVYDEWPPYVYNTWVNILPGTPAFTVEQNGVRCLYSLAAWLNPGVIAHEQSHISYSVLSPDAKNRFATAYHGVKSDPLIQLMYSIHTYGLSSDIEAHAEIYRYLGDKMPQVLKQYYPKLF